MPSRARSFFPLSLRLLVVLLTCTFLAPVASAQSVEAVVGNMEALHEKQLQTVNSFIVETNHYTSYYEKTTRGATPTYRSATRLKSDGDPAGGTGFPSEGFSANQSPSTIYGFDFEKLRQHARYGGTQTIGGATAHVLIVDDPAALGPEMEEATRLVYHVDAKRHLPVRMTMESKSPGDGSRGDGSEPTVVVDLKDYRTTKGLTLPHRMEMQIDVGMSEEERREMQQMMEQLKAMPERQRRQMEKMMGDRMDMMKGLLSSEPVVIEVLSVQVNAELPDGIFASSGAN